MLGVIFLRTILGADARKKHEGTTAAKDAAADQRVDASKFRGEADGATEKKDAADLLAD